MSTSFAALSSGGRRCSSATPSSPASAGQRLDRYDTGDSSLLTAASGRRRSSIGQLRCNVRQWLSKHMAGAKNAANTNLRRNSSSSSSSNATRFATLKVPAGLASSPLGHQRSQSLPKIKPVLVVHTHLNHPSLKTLVESPRTERLTALEFASAAHIAVQVTTDDQEADQTTFRSNTPAVKFDPTGLTSTLLTTGSFVNQTVPPSPLTPVTILSPLFYQPPSRLARRQSAPESSAPSPISAACARDAPTLSPLASSSFVSTPSLQSPSATTPIAVHKVGRFTVTVEPNTTPIKHTPATAAAAAAHAAAAKSAAGSPTTNSASPSSASSVSSNSSSNTCSSSASTCFDPVTTTTSIIPDSTSTVRSLKSFDHPAYQSSTATLPLYHHHRDILDEFPELKRFRCQPPSPHYNLQSARV
ncbi:hypothetical protein DFS34DRAFT_15139 [Phlyctochytrium arcticum]|nr:hypothetical protein DFS34DRAFT_15139 [Phlyctochytrium arcticum]